MSRTVLRGAVDQSAYLRILNADGTAKTDVVFNSAGLDIFYRRTGSAAVAFSEVTQTVNGIHTDGGFVHVRDGYYRIDVPDAAFAAGADDVLVAGAVTGGVIVGELIQLVSATASGGLPSLRAGTAQSATASTIVLDAGASSIDDFYNGTFITAAGQTRQVIDYVGSTRTAVVYVAGPPVQGAQWVTTPAGEGLSFSIHGFAITPTAVSVSGGVVSASLSTAERQALANELLDLANTIETGVNVRGSMRLMLAALAGKVSGAGTGTEVFRNAVQDSKARITATVDSNGNRSAITHDLA